MTKIDIISGFLGAGKTTLIKKLLAEAFQGEKLVLIENEFGEISIDGGFLKESGVQISEMHLLLFGGRLQPGVERRCGPVPAGPYPDRAFGRGQAVGRDRSGGEHRRRGLRHEAEQFCYCSRRIESKGLYEELRGVL